MKKTNLILVLVLSLACALVAMKSFAQTGDSTQKTEYATIRWGGRENSTLIRPGGNVEFIGRELFKMKRPERVDERAFYLNLVINSLAKEGYEVATAVNSDEILMRRPAR